LGKIRKNLIGKKIGMLKIISINETIRCDKRYMDYFNCLCDCGKESIKSYRYLLSTYDCERNCGCFASERNRTKYLGSRHPAYKGGYKGKKGYIEVSVNGKKVLQHRHLYEQHYGIKLLPHQNVHHMNGDRTDNRIENLELWDTSQPKGQRVDDKIKFYFELIEQYKDHPLYKHLIP
jgi:hypothetical protein